jgi:predicted membrane protein
LLLIILSGILFYQKEKIFGFMVLFILIAFVFVRFARMKDNDDLDIRSNSMLTNFYVRTAFFFICFSWDCVFGICGRRHDFVALVS